MMSDKRKTASVFDLFNLSENTNRARRNAMVATFLSIIIAFFGLDLNPDFSVLGLKLKNLEIDHIYVIISIITLYQAVLYLQLFVSDIKNNLTKIKMETTEVEVGEQEYPDIDPETGEFISIRNPERCYIRIETHKLRKSASCTTKVGRNSMTENNNFGNEVKLDTYRKFPYENPQDYKLRLYEYSKKYFLQWENLFCSMGTGYIFLNALPITFLFLSILLSLSQILYGKVETHFVFGVYVFIALFSAVFYSRNILSLKNWLLSLSLVYAFRSVLFVYHTKWEIYLSYKSHEHAISETEKRNQ